MKEKKKTELVCVCVCRLSLKTSTATDLKNMVMYFDDIFVISSAGGHEGALC